MTACVWSTGLTWRTLLTWVQVWRRFGQGRPAFDAAGQFDVRCPTCSYSMIGLYDTRCPECGERLTLDQLLLQQGFDETRQRLGRGAEGDEGAGVESLESGV